jgi:hypothetical protein
MGKGKMGRHRFLYVSCTVYHWPWTLVVTQFWSCCKTRCNKITKVTCSPWNCCELYSVHFFTPNKGFKQIWQQPKPNKGWSISIGTWLAAKTGIGYSLHPISSYKWSIFAHPDRIRGNGLSFGLNQQLHMEIGFKFQSKFQATLEIQHMTDG